MMCVEILYIKQIKQRYLYGYFLTIKDITKGSVHPKITDSILNSLAVVRLSLIKHEGRTS